MTNPGVGQLSVGRLFRLYHIPADCHQFNSQCLPDVTKVYFHATALLAHIHCLVVLVRGHGLETEILQSWSWSWF